MKKIHFYTRNIAFSALLGCLLGMAYVGVLSSGWEENAVRYGTYGITVLVGLFASAIAVGGVLLNLNKQQELIERRHISARAVLPLTLSRLHKLTEHGFETVLNVPKLREGPKEEAINQFQKLQIPGDDIKQIRECIEAADGETQAWLSLILAHWQLETSRLESTLLSEAMNTTPRQLASSGIDWLTIRAMVIHLFDYSRTGQVPNATLRSKYIAVPILSKHLHNAELAEARTLQLESIGANGGWTFEGFKDRFVSASDQSD